MHCEIKVVISNILAHGFLSKCKTFNLPMDQSKSPKNDKNIELESFFMYKREAIFIH